MLPQSHFVLADLLKGPQRSSLLRQRYGKGTQDTIKLLRRVLPAGWNISGAWKMYQSKWGTVKDYEYSLERATETTADL